jgi:NAD+ synthase
MEYRYIVNWLSKYSIESNTKSFVIGVSGGIDSAVTSTLAAQTGVTTYCLLMPIHQHTDHTNRGKEHIKWLKSKYNNIIELTFDLTAIYETFKTTLNPYVTDLSLANARARLRMTTLYNIAQMQDGLVVGTGNKVEDFGVGFYTKYGDGGVDLSPIGDLLKSEVYEVGRELGIIDSIMKAPPTDGLFGDSRTDEEQLGATYDELEWAMNYQENTNLSDRELEVLKIYRNLNKKNKHKMNPIPVYLKTKN